VQRGTYADTYADARSYRYPNGNCYTYNCTDGDADDSTDGYPDDCTYRDTYTNSGANCDPGRHTNTYAIPCIAGGQLLHQDAGADGR